MKKSHGYFLFAWLFLYSCTPQEAPTTFTDSRDGKVYKTVTIGDQVWMAENLTYLPLVVGKYTISNTEPYYYVYGYDGTDLVAAKISASYQIYGALYNWTAARTACPQGWHLPSDADWTQLEDYLIANGYNYDGTTEGNKIAKSMANASAWYSSSVEGATGNTAFSEYNNKSGFSGIPGGFRYNEVNPFSYVGYHAIWWSSTGASPEAALYRALDYNNSNLIRFDCFQDYGLSVRCIRD